MTANMISPGTFPDKDEDAANSERYQDLLQQIPVGRLGPARGHRRRGGAAVLGYSNAKSAAPSRNRRSAARESASSAQPRAAASSASSDAAANASVAVSNLADTSMPRDRRI